MTGQPAARISDAVKGGVIVTGSRTVLIGSHQHQPLCLRRAGPAPEKAQCQRKRPSQQLLRLGWRSAHSYRAHRCTEARAKADHAHRVRAGQLHAAGAAQHQSQGASQAAGAGADGWR